MDTAVPPTPVNSEADCTDRPVLTTDDLSDSYDIPCSWRPSSFTYSSWFNHLYTE